MQSIASPIADPGFVSLIMAQSDNFVEIDQEIFSTVILLLPLIKEGLVSVTRERNWFMCMKYVLVNCLVKLAQEKVLLG